MTEDSSRITKVTTRNGDKGQTRLGNNAKVSKASALIRALGSADELNSAIGLLRCHLPTPEHDAALAEQQQLLFDIGAVLAMAGEYETTAINTGLNAVTEHSEHLNAELPPLQEFVIPGGNLPAAQAHMCRTICRRAETDLWAAAADMETQDAEGTAIERVRQAGTCLNRLSDYFFVLARTLMLGQSEKQWRGPSADG
ncbi:MAG: cob(I)yrinic acid a,c-diamide adenosyltransferase [Pseudomonadales bacterium]|nr:cob(I)yrinic acid a,c-diamide adenosyltransferase [Pseudomonadales bacterium]